MSQRKNAWEKEPSMELEKISDARKLEKLPSARTGFGTNVWKPFEGRAGIKTPSYACRFSFMYQMLKPVYVLPGKFQYVTIYPWRVIAWLVALGLVVMALGGCDPSGNACTYALIATYLTIPHNSPICWLLGISFERGLEFHILYATTAIVIAVIHYPGFCGPDTGGFFLSGFMIAMSALAMEPVRRRYFELFYKFHIVLNVGVIVSCLFHFSTDKAAMAASVWMADVVYRYGYLAMYKHPKKASLKALPSDVACIQFPKGDFNYRAGQYIFLCIPELTSLEWHPYSISSAPYEDNVTIHSRALGDWSQRLYDLALAAGHDGVGGASREIKILFEGPYGEPTVDIDSGKYKSVLIITGGIGITPMQSICKDLLAQYMRGRPMNKIWFVWSVADRYMVDSVWSHDFDRAVNTTSDSAEPDPMYDSHNFERLPHSFSPDTFLRLSNQNMVREEKTDVEHSEEQPFDPLYTEFYLTRVRKEEDFAAANIRPKYEDQVRFGRPNLDEIFAKMKEMSLAHGDKEVAVLTCGPLSMINDVTLKSQQYSGSGVSFHTHHEIFDF